MNWVARRRNKRKPFDERRELVPLFETLNDFFSRLDQHRARDKDFRAAKRCVLDLIRLLSILNNPLIWKYSEYCPALGPRVGAGKQARKREASIERRRGPLMMESATVTQLEAALRFVASEFRDVYDAFRAANYKIGKEHKQPVQEHAFRCGTMLPAVIRHLERVKWTALRTRI
jgi:hypothetical protein